MTGPRLRRLLTVGLALALGGLTACSSGTTAPSGSASSATSSGGDPISIVASTNVYGNIAATIGGDRVKVSSIISSPDQDPHSFEANAGNQLELSKARVVIANGGGYDDFLATLLKTARNRSATLIDVVKLSGKRAPATGGFNEHVWYDFPTIARLAAALRTTLTQADPGGARTFSANAATFAAGLQALQRREALLKSVAGGRGVVVTEPVPLYLTEACGLVNKTPAQFSRAIEEGTDVPPLVLAQTLKLFTAKQVALLAYNEQTGGPQSEKVRAAAKAAGVPVVGVTETLPGGKDYLSWMAANLDAVKAAVSS
ncbi:MAG: zinc ABC transporter substrate-binding protein [Actinomycetota bacterium]|nr:zinc ABC transporter substrate-binding protein [Actinomycetota bacterium]